MKVTGLFFRKTGSKWVKKGNKRGEKGGESFKIREDKHGRGIPKIRRGALAQQSTKQ